MSDATGSATWMEGADEQTRQSFELDRLYMAQANAQSGYEQCLADRDRLVQLLNEALDRLELTREAFLEAQRRYRKGAKALAR